MHGRAANTTKWFRDQAGSGMFFTIHSCVIPDRWAPLPDKSVLGRGERLETWRNRMVQSEKEKGKLGGHKKTRQTAVVCRVG